MKSDDHDRSSWLRLSFFLLLALCLVACGGGIWITKKKVNNSNEKGRVLWEGGEQYVRLSSSDRVVNNQHPIAITAENMRTVLESLLVPERHFISKKLYPVFSPAEIQVLSSALTEGLALARPDQDVTFVTIGLHRGLLAKVHEANTGRVFFKDGKLQIIFGMIHEEVSDQNRQTGEQIDRRLHPFVVGSRLFESKLSSTITLEDGIAFYLDSESGKERGDWLVLDVPTILAKTDHNISNGQINPSLLEDITRSKQENQNLKKDLANIKEVVFELKERLLELQQGNKGAATMEERLRSLKDLHDSGLISGDEYQDKRRELLNNL
jgi:hypothetical protein